MSEAWEPSKRQSPGTKAADDVDHIRKRLDEIRAAEGVSKKSSFLPGRYVDGIWEADPPKPDSNEDGA